MKRVFNIIQNIFTVLLVALAVGMLIFTVISVTMFDHVDRDLFGYKTFIVLSDSMSKTDFSAGDLVITRQVDPDTLQPGDIITYQSNQPENYGKMVTHRIRRRTTDAVGNPAFITYGTTTGVDDLQVVTYPYVVGKMQVYLPKVGSFFWFLKTREGYLTCILLPFLLLLLSQGIRSIRLFQKYKAEVALEQRMERARLAMERKQLQEDRMLAKEMMQELQRMRSNMDKS